MGIRLTFLLIASAMVGCSGSKSTAIGTETLNGSDLRSSEVWTVDADGDFENGEQLIAMEHGRIEETGEHWAAQIYGLKITNADRETYLLWMNSPFNPFGLKNGDQFRFTQTIEHRFFDEYKNGYHASKEDIEIVRRNGE